MESICVPDCELSPYLTNNEATQECQVCSVNDPQNICTACHRGVCYKEIKLTEDFFNRDTCSKYQLASQDCDFYCQRDNQYYNSATNKCQSCDISCRTCAIGGAQNCITCYSGFYLTEMEQGGQTGTCKEKIPSDGSISEIYVTNSDTYNEDGKANQERDGSESNPFVNLRDALVKADEMTAPFSNHNIAIYLSPGTHHIVLQSDYYSHSGNRDEADRDYHLSIQPLDCSLSPPSLLCNGSTSEKPSVTISNKIGAFFRLTVPRSLTLSNLIFSSLDSEATEVSATPNYCASLRSDICSLDEASRSASSLSPECDCSLSLASSRNCVLPVPNPLISFDYNSAVSSLSAPKSLLIQESEFHSFFYPFSNLVQVPPQGANITLSRSHFHHLSSCGAVIGNINSTQLPPVTTAITYSLRANLHDFTGDGSSIIASYDPSSMSAITIDSSIFEHLDFLFTDDSYAPRPDYFFEGGYSHFSRASALLLYSLDIPLFLLNSTFSQIRYPLSHLFPSLDFSATTSNALYTGSSGFLIEAVIYLRSHGSQVQLLHNTFSHCGGVKGPVIIELDLLGASASSPAAAFILSNSFLYNTGVFSGGALALFSSVGSTSLSSDSSFCGGFLVQNNNFTGNIVIQEGGIIKHQCLSSVSSASQANYLIRHEYYSTDTTSADKWDNYKDFNSYQPTFESLILKNGEAINYDPKMTHISVNEFIQNMRSKFASIIFLERTPFFYLSDNIFTSNQNLFIALYLTSLHDFIEKGTGLASVTALGDSLFQDSARMLPLIYSNLGLSLLIERNDADSNPVSVGSHHQGSNCASTMEFSFLAAQTPRIQQSLITRPTTLNFQFLSRLDLTYSQPQPYVSTTCSTLRFDRISSESSILLQDLNVNNGEYYFDSVANLLFSYSAVDFSSFVATTAPQGNISVSNLNISNFNCTDSCLLIGSPPGGLTLDGLTLQSLHISGDSYILELTNNVQANTFVSNIEMRHVQITHEDGALIKSFAGYDLDNYELNLSNIQISECTLPPMAVQIYSSVRLVISNFQIYSSTYHHSTQLANARFFTFQTQDSVYLSDLNWDFNVTTSKLSYFLTAINIQQFLTLHNINLNAGQTGSIAEPAMLVNFDSTSQIFSIIHCTFQGINSTENIGLLNAQGNGQVYIYNSTFEALSAKGPSVFSFSDDLRVNIVDSNFRSNQAKFIGGAITSSDRVMISIMGCTFEENKAHHGGALYFSDAVNYKIENTIFRWNRASAYGSAIFVMSLDGFTITTQITNCTFIENRGAIGTFVLLFGQATISGSRFIDNFAFSASANIAALLADLWISTTEFSNTEDFVEEEFKESIPAMNGYFLFLGIDSYAEISLCSFSRGLASRGAAIYCGSYSHFYLDQSLVEYSRGILGSIYSVQGTNFEINHCVFRHNEGTAADVRVQSPNEVVRIMRSSFISGVGGLGFFDLISLDFYNNTVSNYGPISWPLLYIEDGQCFNISLNHFSSLTVPRTIYINSELSTSTQKYIVGNRFEKIAANVSGGALSLHGTINILIQNNSFDTIYYNQENGQQGAAIYISSNSYLTQIRSNSFINCSAYNGGAIKWNDRQPLFEDNTFINNSALVYGDDQASYAVGLALRTYEQLPALYRDSRKLREGGRSLQTDIGKFTGVQSSGTLGEVFLVFVDNLNQVVTSSNQDTISFTLEGLSSEYTPRYDAGVSLWSNMGVFNLTDVVFIGGPGSAVSLSVSSSFINGNLQQVDPNYSLQLDIAFRNCISGEEFTSDGQCLECPAGTYIIDAPTSPTNCNACPANADCFGGNRMAPKPGYWRSSDTSLTFLKCYAPSACIGSSSDNLNPQGDCYAGYRGILCAQCETGYVANSNFQCAACPQMWKNVLLLIFIVLLATLVIVFFIRVTLSSMKAKKSNVSVYLKILTNHLQLIVITLNFNLDWPNEVNKLNETTKPLADVSSRIISFDCFLGQGLLIRRVFIYFLTYLLLPLFLGGVSFLFWQTFYRHNRSKAMSRLTTTLIILLFLFHPSITNNIFGLFYCRRIDQDFRLIGDLDLKCFQDSHFYWALLGGVPGLLLWVAGIPMGTWLLLRESKDQLENSQIKNKYGFLFKGYRPHTYYWESVIMYRKVAMIFVSVFLQALGTRIQAFSVFLLIIIFVVLTSKKRPYLTRQLNDLQQISLITSGVTIYSGLFFLSSLESSSSLFDPTKDYELSNEGRWFFFFLIILSNLLFLVSWLWNFFGEIKGKCRLKFPKVYVCLCLCCRKSLLAEEVSQEKNSKYRETIIEQVDNLRAKLLMARDQLIRGEEFEDQEKFKRFVQISSHQISKMNFERKNERVHHQGDNGLRNNQILPKQDALQTVCFQDLFTMRSNDQSIYYDTISQRPVEPARVKQRGKELVERRETLRSAAPKKPRSRSFEEGGREQLKSTDLNFTLDESIQYLYEGPTPFQEQEIEL